MPPETELQRVLPANSGSGGPGYAAPPFRMQNAPQKGEKGGEIIFHSLALGSHASKDRPF